DEHIRQTRERVGLCLHSIRRIEKRHPLVRLHQPYEVDLLKHGLIRLATRCDDLTETFDVEMAKMSFVNKLSHTLRRAVERYQTIIERLDDRESPVIFSDPLPIW